MGYGGRSMIGGDDTYWRALAEHSPLGILTDLDGTLLPFAATPAEARPTPEILSLVADLSSLDGVTLAIVSGRPRETLDEFFPAPRSFLLAAEHGAWRCDADGWRSTLAIDERAIDQLAKELRALMSKYPLLTCERKTWSFALHFRRLPEHRKPGMLVQASAVVDPWLDAHPEFEPLWGAQVLEIRPKAARKSTAVTWMREHLGADARLLVVGDDMTDEDMFAAASDGDATVVVDPELDRDTKARFRLGSVADVHRFYRDVVKVRRRVAAKPSVLLRPATPRPQMEAQAFDLLVLSNRLPELRSATSAADPRKKSVGGLVSALRPVLEARRGIWLGWSGRAVSGATGDVATVETHDGLSLASVDFPEAWQRHYYNGFSNGSLWPLLHSFPSRARFANGDWDAYRQANEAFARVATKLVEPNATIWVHDYHLLLLARELRARGHRGRIGLFQHIPFPGPDIFFLLPWAHEVLEAMLDFDLVGFHTRTYARNFESCLGALPAPSTAKARVRAGAFPLGIMPEEFQPTADGEASAEIDGLLRAIEGTRLVLGVDRLDYTKGIPERIDAFGRLLELHPAWRRKVSLVQVSVPSRADIPEYAEQRRRVENSVGRVNGELGEADWVPIRYLYRSYGRRELAQLYRAAHVGYVTPLRDGMNLVAKEYVAAQDALDPGVLLLSRFAGAAEELSDALLTNPWHPEGTAHDLDRALRMTLEERARRHASLAATVGKTSALTWAEDFLADLAR
jgi:trehalose 6-phosphate synthase